MTCSSARTNRPAPWQLGDDLAGLDPEDADTVASAFEAALAELAPCAAYHRASGTVTTCYSHGGIDLAAAYAAAVSHL